MRKIKFKVWYPKTKEMLDSNAEGVLIHLDGEVNHLNEDAQIIGTDNVPDVLLLEYTGLKDKNGKEIYEGDILTSNHYPFQDDGKYNYHGVVEWGEEEAAFFLTKALANTQKRGVSHGISESLMNYDITEFEIIGNIHENPELLKIE